MNLLDSAPGQQNNTGGSLLDLGSSAPATNTATTSGGQTLNAFEFMNNTSSSQSQPAQPPPAAQSNLLLELGGGSSAAPSQPSTAGTSQPTAFGFMQQSSQPSNQSNLLEAGGFQIPQYQPEQKPTTTPNAFSFMNQQPPAQAAPPAPTVASDPFKPTSSQPQGQEQSSFSFMGQQQPQKQQPSFQPALANMDLFNSSGMPHNQYNQGQQQQPFIPQVQGFGQHTSFANAPQVPQYNRVG